MQVKSAVLGLLVAGAGGIAAQTALADEYRGTFEQQLACTPDVWRLCSNHIPDVNRIVACLRQNTPQLSDGCRAVFESSNSTPQPPGYQPQRGDNSAPLPPRNNDGWFR